MSAECVESSLVDVIEGLDDGLVVLDPEWRIVYANGRAAANVGHTPEDLVGRNIWESFPAILGTDHESAYRRAMAERLPVIVDTRGVLTPRWYRLAAYPCRQGIAVVWTDVTERKEAEEALRLQSATASELLATTERATVIHALAERIYALAEGGVVTIAEFDPATSSVTVREMQSTPDERERTIALLGRSPVGLTLVFPEETRRRWKPGELALVPGGLHELLFRQVPAAACQRVERELGVGDVFGMGCAYEQDILATVAVVTKKRAPLRNQQLIEALVAQAALALKRIRADETRQRVEHRFRLLFESTSDGVWIHTLDGVIREVNDAYCAMSGYRRAELEGMPIGTLEVLESPSQIAAHVARVVEGGGSDRFESKHRRKDGSLFDVDITAVYLEHDGGRIAIFVRDITERKRAEQALRDAKERLEDADRRKDQFLAILSHELRNPLAPIVSSLRVLDRSAPGGEHARRAKAVIERQVDQLARLVDDLLDVTRITSGTIHLQRRRLDLGALVRRTFEDHRSLVERAGLRLALEAAPDAVLVDADENRVAQVLGNLLQNAAKFTPRGGEVTVSLSTEPAAGRAVVRVSDTGVGMEPEMLGRLFQPFIQADTTLDRSKGGLGLGLALVKGLVQQHGGTVDAESAGLGRGAAVTFRLPLAMPEPLAAAGPRAEPVKARRRVLVIEDNSDAADSLKDALEIEGHVVWIARDGPDGLRRAIEVHPDLVLCDIGLPGMDGYDVARAFRSDPALRAVPLVALSGYALPEDLQRATEAGFDAHLAKPASLDTIEALFARIPVAHDA